MLPFCTYLEGRPGLSSSRTRGRRRRGNRTRSLRVAETYRQKLASGLHYASPRQLPLVCGTDGVGHLTNGQRVFFGGPRSPYGAMAQRTVVSRAFTFPVPEGVNDETAAGLPNPGVSAWLSLAFRAKLAPGENVLILGATGVTGKLAITIAKFLGAGRVVAAGRNQQVLSTLHRFGADATIDLGAPLITFHGITPGGGLRRACSIRLPFRRRCRFVFNDRQQLFAHVFSTRDGSLPSASSIHKEVAFADRTKLHSSTSTDILRR